MSFMRPFGCPVTILNNLDPLGKFDGKANKGFLVGYSINCKAFRVFNSRTRIVQETLHINFLVNKPNVAGIGPKWLFDINTLTMFMNYQPVVVGNQPNDNVGINEILNTDPKNTYDDVADDAFEVKENENDVYVSANESAKTYKKKHDENAKRDDKGKSIIDLITGVRDLRAKFKEFSFNSTNRVNAVSKPVNAVGPNPTNSTTNFNTASPSVNAVSLNFGIAGQSLFVDPSKYLDDPDMPELEDIVYSYDEEDVGAEADLSNLETNIRMDFKSAFLYGTIEEEVYVCQPPGFEDLAYLDKVYKVVKALYGLHQATRAWKCGFTDVKSASTPIKTEKPLLKDPDGEDVNVHIYRFQVTPKVSHLQAVKRIFRYLKGKSHLGLWYPRDSPFNMVAYSNSDYARASLNRKSTTGGCQFLGCRLISWQYIKQTVVATSSTEAEYIDFETRFVPQTKLSAEQAFWSWYSVNSKEPNLSSSTTIVEVPKECPKVSMVNSSLKKLKFHLASFDVVVKERTTTTAITEGTKKVLVITALKETLSKLKGKVVVNEAVTLHPIGPELLKIDVAPLAPKLRNNITAHNDYLKHTQEETATLREIVENERLVNPLNTSLYYALGNVCPLTRITTTAIVPLRKPIPIESNTTKPVVTLVYSRKSKAAQKKVLVSNSKINKSLVSRKKEPNNSWGSTSSNVPSSIIECMNDHVAKIMGYGDYKIGNVTISRVYFVEGLGHNLFSLGQFCDSDLEVAFRQHTCFIRNLDGVGLLTGSRENKIFLDTTPTPQDTPPPYQPPTPHDIPLQDQPTTPYDSPMPLLTTLMETCATLSQKVFELEKDKNSPALDILQLKKRVKRLERKNKSNTSGLKRLRKGRTNLDAASKGVSTVIAPELVSTAEPTVFDDEDIAQKLRDEEVQKVAARDEQERADIEKALELQRQLDEREYDIDWSVVAEQVKER
nr:hypothetical protein [Tanacetum cinerariifolium]